MIFKNNRERKNNQKEEFGKTLSNIFNSNIDNLKHQKYLKNKKNNNQEQTQNQLDKRISDIFTTEIDTLNRKYQDQLRVENEFAQERRFVKISPYVIDEYDDVLYENTDYENI